MSEQINLGNSLTALNACKIDDDNTPDIALETMFWTKKASVNDFDEIERETLRNWLVETSDTKFLRALPNADYLNDWVELAFKIIQKIDYSFLNMFEDRVKELGSRTLFIESQEDGGHSLSYDQVFRDVRETAAALYSLTKDEPKVAILSENSPEGAICDLACLCYDILVSPINVHFTEDELIQVFNSIGFNVAITDSPERIKKLEALRERVDVKFDIYHINRYVGAEISYPYLPRECKKLSKAQAEQALNARRKKPINEVATVMFTSGSTGKPKGVAFSNYNILSKRFARAAALPYAGDKEIALCYLPLFHTFGRYLEMTGMIYWRGTYVFVGGGSAETLINLFPKFNPTMFISVPIRWVQLYDKIIEEMQGKTSAKDCEEAFRSVVGTGLKRGLSAAGYLDPKVFMFFQRNGVELASGFGMTEATGGITMTPPEKYVENTVGRPLPGIYAKLNENNEMLISGHYVARYLGEVNIGEIIDFPKDLETDFWSPTGDIFTVDNEGYYSIIDRIKDIYKNNKGQTLSPRNVEIKFEGAPGFKRTFLVGDARAYNVLFIVPDYDFAFANELDKANYYEKIILEVNKELAPYERVINYAILDRDFDLEKGELTPKGSYNRKNIERNFADIIDLLYVKNYVEIQADGFKITIPRRLFRDKGTLETDFKYENGVLVDLAYGFKLTILKVRDGAFQIGDLIYEIKGKNIDLGIFFQLPTLWGGNPELVNFAPVSEGWDVKPKGINIHAKISEKSLNKYIDSNLIKLRGIKNLQLAQLHELLVKILFSAANESLEKLEELAGLIPSLKEKVAEVVRYRLQALAYHPFEKTRIKAYSILLDDDFMIERGETFPTFLESGLSFMDTSSITEIASGKLEYNRLDALRRRLEYYRENLERPFNPFMVKRFKEIFSLLVETVKNQPDCYYPVRAELANWILFKAEPGLAKAANQAFWNLSTSYEAHLEKNSHKYTEDFWMTRLNFEDGMPEADVNAIKKALIGNEFLRQSIILAHDEPSFELSDVAERGIWISRIGSQHNNSLFRICVNTKKNRIYDLQMVLSIDLKKAGVLETVFWLLVISGSPERPAVLPKIGAARPELEARTMAYSGELTVWEKIREISAYRSAGKSPHKPGMLRKLFTEGIAAFIRAWKYSGKQIVPGIVSPGNVSIPELDMPEGATILSLAGRLEYENTLSLIKPIVNNFYRKTVHHYPWTREKLDLFWLFDAVVESLGYEDALEFFDNASIDMKCEEFECAIDFKVANELERYLVEIEAKYRKPSILLYAIDRYFEWEITNPGANPAIKEQAILELIKLFNIDKQPEIARYQLYRDTYFADKDSEVLDAFDKLLNALNSHKKVRAAQLIELSDLQSSITHEADREAFSKMAFPISKSKAFDMLRTTKKRGLDVILQSTLVDSGGEKYSFREPADAAELGSLYRLFYKEKMSFALAEDDMFIAIFDSQNRIIGGVNYRLKEENSVYLGGIVLARQYRGKKLGRETLLDFFARMQAIGMESVRTNALSNEFYTKLGFKHDRRYGLAVKDLGA